MKTKTEKPKSTKTIDLPKSPDFERALELLDALGSAQDELKNIEAITAEHIRGVLRDIKAKYSQHQERATIAEQLLEAICRKHPEWFSKKKTLPTIFGSLSLRKSTKLVIPNEEASVLLIKEAMRDNVVTGLIRTKEELDLEALERLDDSVLALFRIRRVTEEHFSAKPASLDLGKAIADDQKQAA